VPRAFEQARTYKVAVKGPSWPGSSRLLGPTGTPDEPSIRLFSLLEYKKAIPLIKFSSTEDKKGVPMKQFCPPEWLFRLPERFFAVPEKLFCLPVSKFSIPESIFCLREELFGLPEGLFAVPANRKSRPEAAGLVFPQGGSTGVAGGASAPTLHRL